MSYEFVGVKNAIIKSNVEGEANGGGCLLPVKANVEPDTNKSKINVRIVIFFMFIP